MEAEAASLSTETLATELASTWSMSISTPSTSTSGDWSELMEPMPRTRMLPPSEPGWPEVYWMVTPGIAPCKAVESEATERLVRFLALTDDTAPVSVAFFCVA